VRNLVCKCCGMKFKARGKLKYAPGHAPSRSEIARKSLSNTAKQHIPIEEFRPALLKIKNESGLSWRELADRAGRSFGAFTDLVYGPNKYWVSHEVAEDIFKRLSGISMPPTPRQEAQYTVLRRKDQSEQRAVTLKDNKLQERKVKIAALREQLG